MYELQPVAVPIEADKQSHCAEHTKTYPGKEGRATDQVLEADWTIVKNKKNFEDFLRFAGKKMCIVGKW